MKVIKDGKVEHVITAETEDSIYETNQELNLSMIKPVLKRSLYHNGQPAIITFKTFEVWLVHQSAG